jgi:hypothetical protein
VTVNGLNLAELARSLTSGDGPQSTACVVNSAGNPVIDGPHGAWSSGYTFSASSSNHENAVADTASGAIRVASVGNRAKLIYTEPANGGSVLFWNGNAALGDWDESASPDMSAMLRNTIQSMNVGCSTMQGGDCDDNDSILVPGTCP